MFIKRLFLIQNRDKGGRESCEIFQMVVNTIHILQVRTHIRAHMYRHTNTLTDSLSGDRLVSCKEH